MINQRKLFFKMFPEIFSVSIFIGIFLLNNMWSYHLEKNYFNDLTHYHNIFNIYELVKTDFKSLSFTAELVDFGLKY